MASVEDLLRAALRTADDTTLRTALLTDSGLPGPRLNLTLVEAFGAAVAAVVTGPDLDVTALERLLDGWAALPPADAPGDAPAVILPCAAVAAYGYVAATRPDWWPDEIVKLQRAAADPRWRVRELVATALQRLLAADRARTAAELAGWAADPDPLVARAAAAAISPVE